MTTLQDIEKTVASALEANGWPPYEVLDKHNRELCRDIARRVHDLLAMQDLAAHGIAITQGGERIDPRDFYVQPMTPKEVQEAAARIVEEATDGTYRSQTAAAIRAMPLTK